MKKTLREILESKKVKVVSSEEALKGVIPIDWSEEWDTGPDVGEEVIENHQGYYDSEDSCDRIIKSLEDRAEEAFKKIARNRSKALEGGFVNGEDYERWLVENRLEEDKDD